MTENQLECVYPPASPSYLYEPKPHKTKMTAASKSSESIPKDNELVHNTGYYNQDELLTDELSSYNDDNIPDTWNVATTTHTHTPLFYMTKRQTQLSISKTIINTQRNCVVCSNILRNVGVFFLFRGRGAR